MKKTGDQWAIPCAIIRGGTSKGVYFLEEDLPSNSQERDTILKRLMGNPDKEQLDGLGGGKINTSKVAIIRRSQRADADVDYTFGEVNLTEDKIDYSGTCGNIIAGVGVFAFLKKLVQPTSFSYSLKIFNTNINKVITATYSLQEGYVTSRGDYAIAGISYLGSEIKLDFSQTSGAKTGKLLPSDQVQNDITLSNGQMVTVSLCDVANPCVFLNASTLGLKGDEAPSVITETVQYWGYAEELRGKAAVLMGLIQDWRKINDYFDYLPFVTLIAAGKTAGEISARVILQNQCYNSMPATGMICLAAAASIPGSLVNHYDSLKNGIINIEHPLGVSTVECQVKMEKQDIVFTYLGFSRTARLLMVGDVFIPEQ